MAKRPHKEECATGVFWTKKAFALASKSNNMVAREHANCPIFAIV
jgi:hypothetical protein